MSKPSKLLAYHTVSPNTATEASNQSLREEIELNGLSVMLCSMNRVSVSSSNLRSVGYNEEEQILEIEFNGGRVYQYFNVPPKIHNGLMAASSHGKYFHRNIKDTYSYDQIK
jgi:hypothetical protein